MFRTSGLALAAGAAVAADAAVGCVATGCTPAQAVNTLNASTVKTRHINKERLLILLLLFQSALNLSWIGLALTSGLPASQDHGILLTTDESLNLLSNALQVPIPCG